MIPYFSVAAFLLLFISQSIGQHLTNSQNSNAPEYYAKSALNIDSPLKSINKISDNFKSNLPIVIIDTKGQSIPDGTKITAQLKVINHGLGILNQSTDTTFEYNGFIGIEIRGHFSTTFPQKSYGLETRDSLGNNNNVSLMGMPKENDWILIPNYDDKSFDRNLLSFDLFRKMGHYATRGRLCEVILNSQYHGIYVFSEKIKPDKNRLTITKMTTGDNSGVALTGGYIISVDYSDGNDYWTSSYPPFYYPDRKVQYNYVYPKSDDITSQQKNYIQKFVKAAEGALYGKGFTNPSIGYPKYVDVPSFIDYFILSEVSRNVDGYKKSRYFFKNRDDKDSLLNAGPVWDFDWAWKNITECIFGNTDGSGWGYKTNDCQASYAVPDWHIRLLQDGNFTYPLIARYQALRTGLLDLNNINSFIDSIAAVVNDAKERHFALYPISAPNAAPEVESPSKTYDEEIARLKEWIRKRILWLDLNIPKLTENIITNSKTSEINIINQSFELPGMGKIKGWDGKCADPNWTGLVYDIPGWSSDSLSFDSGEETGQGASDGIWSAFLFGKDAPVYQTTDYSIQTNDKIALTVSAKNNGGADLFKMTLFYLNGSFVKIPIVSNTFNISGVMEDYSISFSSSGFSSSVGRKLGIMLSNVSSISQSWIGVDNVRLVRDNPTEVINKDNTPAAFSLSQNFPNPFNPTTLISYSLPKLSRVVLKVYDLLGREVSTLVSEEKSQGTYKVEFNGRQLSSGVYFYTLRAGDFVQTKKMLIMK